jgi:hypothetical protein
LELSNIVTSTTEAGQASLSSVTIALAKSSMSALEVNLTLKAFDRLLLFTHTSIAPQIILEEY